MNDGLDRAGRAEAVARRALRRGDGRPIRLLLAERELDHARLRAVADRRRRAVRVHVADLVGRDARVLERHREGARGARAGRVGVGDVRRVGRDAVAEQLGVDLRAARLRVLELLEHDHRARLAHHEAVALEVERARRRLRVAVPPRDRAHRAEAGDPDARHRRLGAAADHHVGAAEPDRVEAVADRHVRRRARRALGEQRPLRAELHRDPAGGEVRDDLDDRERVDAVRARARRAPGCRPRTTSGRRCPSPPPRRCAPRSAAMSRPASVSACRAAASARCVKRSMRRDAL